MSQPVDSSILHEIVRIIESRRKVPERVQVRAKEYSITYLEDHQRRLEEALQRYDSDRLNMLYGQLASKVKYQLLRRLPAAAAKAVKEKQEAPAKAKTKPPAKAKSTSKPKAAPKKIAGKRGARKTRSGTSGSVRKPAKAKAGRGKMGKAAKSAAARRATPARGDKRGSKRKLAKK